MKTSNDFLKLHYLIFSSHKTATQTLSLTLRENGFRCTHCHILQNLHLHSADFIKLVERNYLANGRQLNIISTFREPMERHISSFFQWYGDGVIRKNLALDITDTVIYKSTSHQLQSQFISEVHDQSIPGTEESIDHICDALKVPFTELSYDDNLLHGLYETEAYRLILFRFDTLIQNLEFLLTKISGRNIIPHSANQAARKWYRDIYTEFKTSLHVPSETIIKSYAPRRHLIDLFYDNAYERMLSSALEEYG